MYFIINIGGSACVRTPSGVTCKSVLQLEATFIDVKNMTMTQTRVPEIMSIL